MTRDQYNFWGGFAAVLFALISLLALVCKNHLPWGWSANVVGGILVAAWAILPPGFFWIDWVHFCEGMEKDNREIAKHTHDLARNIWLGLLGVLTFGFFKLTSL
jgi:hypothetical protein